MDPTDTCLFIFILFYVVPPFPTSAPKRSASSDGVAECKTSSLLRPLSLWNDSLCDLFPHFKHIYSTSDHIALCVFFDVVLGKSDTKLALSSGESIGASRSLFLFRRVTGFDDLGAVIFPRNRPQGIYQLPRTSSDGVAMVRISVHPMRFGYSIIFLESFSEGASLSIQD